MPHGKREEISRFVVRADIPDTEEEQTTAYNKVLFRVPGREGLYYEKPNWIDKYFRRGKSLEGMCPSHLVKMYDPETRGKTSTGVEHDDGDDYEDDDENDNDNSDFSETLKKHGKEAKFHHIITPNGPGKSFQSILSWRILVLENQDS